MRVLLIPAVLITLLAGGLHGQQPQSPPPQNPPAEQKPPQQQPPAEQKPPATQQDAQKQPTFKSSINFVRVDVIISDNKGNPVLDLKQDEFSVFEDGKPQNVETFSVVKIDPLDQVEGPTNAEILYIAR